MVCNWSILQEVLHCMAAKFKAIFIATMLSDLSPSVFAQIWIFSSSVKLDISLVHCLTREILSWTREDKIHIHKRACNNLFIT